LACHGPNILLTYLEKGQTCQTFPDKCICPEIALKLHHWAFFQRWSRKMFTVMKTDLRVSVHGLWCGRGERRFKTQWQHI